MYKNSLMKKPLIILLVLFFHFDSVSAQLPQVCDTTINWNADSSSTIRGIPFNQSICFKIKSTKLDLSNVSSVWILVHRGNKNAEEMKPYRFCSLPCF
jgi:hypothetical protein